jgi:hypothetical protein
MYLHTILSNKQGHIQKRLGRVLKYKYVFGKANFKISYVIGF